MESRPAVSQWQLYRRLLGYLLPYKGIFTISIIAMAINAATSAGFAASMKYLINSGFIEPDKDIVYNTLLAIFIIAFLRGASTFVSDFGIHWVGRSIIFDIRNAAFSHALNLPASFYDKKSSSKLISRLIYDVEQISNSITSAAIILGKEGLTVIFVLAYMIYVDWKLTVFLAFIVPAIAALIRVMSKRMHKASTLIQESVGEITKIVQEVTSGYRVVKSFNAQDHENANFVKASKKNRKQYIKRSIVSSLGTGIVQILAIIAIIAIIYFALQTNNTAGDFVSYITALAFILNPLKLLTKVNESIQTGLAAAASIFKLLSREQEPDEGNKSLSNVRGEVRYENVGFYYLDQSRPALQNISFRIQPGQSIALVGKSGSGKTTIANLLPRFYRVSEGHIYIDDVDTNELKLRNLRDQIAIVGQEAILFDDTILNNIAYGSIGSIDYKRVEAAATAAHLYEFVNEMEEGLDTRVGEKGARLSGGQKQRIAIARAIYKDAPILILDEATSSLDSESEKHVQAALYQLMKDRTTLVIAHRLSTIESADQILVLENGSIVESGNHKALLEKNAKYAALYRNQFNEQD